MLAHRSLRLAWWNTRLTLLKGNANQRTRVLDPGRWQAAARVVQSLGAERKDVLVLGEITQEGADELASTTVYQRVISPGIDARSGIAVLYNRDNVAVEMQEKINIEISDRSTKQSFAYQIYLAGHPPVCLIPSHWPSRGQEKNARDRRRLATDLQVYFQKLVKTATPNATYVVFCGDFNDEPFDASLTECLRGTRDRSVARSNSDVLYNPFWRLLGERDCHGSAPALSHAGTYFNTQNSDTKWYTFDQFLVSQPFVVEKSAWQLLEEETKIWSPSFMRVNNGIAHGFDHYPVTITLEAYNDSSREVDNG